jgi:hypothetical protein
MALRTFFIELVIEFSDEDKAALSYERYNHLHPFVQRKMEDPMGRWIAAKALAE